MSSDVCFTAKNDLLCLFTGIKVNVLCKSVLIWLAVVFGSVTLENNVPSANNFYFDLKLDYPVDH